MYNGESNGQHHVQGNHWKFKLTKNVQKTTTTHFLLDFTQSLVFTHTHHTYNSTYTQCGLHTTTHIHSTHHTYNSTHSQVPWQQHLHAQQVAAAPHHHYLRKTHHAHHPCPCHLSPQVTHPCPQAACAASHVLLKMHACGVVMPVEPSLHDEMVRM